MTRFSGKTLLVTGAASGIGRATARRFADEGANLVVVDRDRSALEQAAAELPQNRTQIQPSDTSSKEAALAAVKAAVDRFGALEVLVNNAGIASKGDITQTSEDYFARVLAVNVGGYFHMAKAAMPELVKTRARS